MFSSSFFSRYIFRSSLVLYPAVAPSSNISVRNIFILIVLESLRIAVVESFGLDLILCSGSTAASLRARETSTVLLI